MNPTSAPPDILVVNELFPPALGGAGVLLHEVYSRLSGLSVHVLTDDRANGGRSGDRPARTLTIHRRPIATRAWGVADPGGLLHHAKVGAYIRSMTDRRRSIVHCGRALPEGVAAWMNHHLRGARYICWSHGEDVSVGLTSRELTWVMTRVYRAASAVIANSANTQSLIVGLGLPAERVPVVHPGVDPTRFRPGVDGRSIRQALLRGGDTVLLSVGRLQLRKGHDLVIEAVAALRDRLPGLRYAIAGDGEERGRLETLASARGVADAVTFMGPVPADDLPACYAACDIFVMPNRQEGADIEGFGIVFLEAAAAERPAIGGRSGGAPEAIEAGLTGLLVGGTDPQELAAVIERLAGDPGLRAALGRAGRERVVNGFTWDHAAARVAAIHAAAGGE